MLLLVKRIFQKNIKDIFITPVITGCKLTVMVMLFTILITRILNYFIHQPILLFIVIVAITATTMILIVWKKPSLLGEYLHYTILQFFKKK
jgi:hypothetical protein